MCCDFVRANHKKKGTMKFDSREKTTTLKLLMSDANLQF